MIHRPSFCIPVCTLCGRVYGACAFTILVGWPLWLKVRVLDVVARQHKIARAGLLVVLCEDLWHRLLTRFLCYGPGLQMMTIDKIKSHKVVMPWKPYGSLHFAPEPLGNEHNCAPCIGSTGCDAGIYEGIGLEWRALFTCQRCVSEKPLMFLALWPLDVCAGRSVRWPLEVRVLNASGEARGGQYVITYTSSKWDGDWYQSSQPTILNSVISNNQTVQVCKVPAELSIAPSLTPTHTPAPIRKRRLLEADATPEARDELVAGGSAAEEEEQRRLESEKISGDDAAISYTDKQLLQCCHGSPGPVYVVACLVDEYFTYARHKQTASAGFGPPFDNRCTAVAGVCGASCGTQVNEPTNCVNGKIPQYKLVSGMCKDPESNDDDDCGPQHEDDFQQQQEIPEGDVFEIQAFDTNWRPRDPGSSEPPVKLYFTQTPAAWHWFFMTMMFMSYVSICVASIPGAGVCGSANERLPILHTLNQNGAIKDGVKCIAFSISASEHKVWVIRNLLGKIASSFMHDSARLYDFFQDEGTRAGAYALWDALVMFMQVPRGTKEDTIGMCKNWAARLRDPAENLSRSLDTFKKDSEAPPVTMSSIEREFDAFDDVHEIGRVKFNIPEEKLSMLHYAYELYDLINCLGDRSVW